MPKLALVTFDLEDNAIGRAYCLWLLAVANGWRVDVLAPRGQVVWEPLRGTAFASACRQVDKREYLNTPDSDDRAELVIAVKPRPEGLELYQAVRREWRVPGFIDIDDPDIEARLVWSRPLRRLVKEVVRPQFFRDWRAARRLALRETGTVSNPVLAATYGGAVIPHVRPRLPFGAEHVSSRPEIAFVGTYRAHKGVEVLRKAVEQLQPQGFSLLVTSDPPLNAKPWERWTGAVPLDRGLEIVAQSDIVVIPTLEAPFSRGQLPVKLMDAMLAGRAIVVSNVEPLPWAVGEAGIVVEPGSVDQLREALKMLQNPELRSERGRQLRSFALSRYTVEAQQEAFREVCDRALSEAQGK